MNAAYLERTDLSAHGFYITPNITGFGGSRPFNYFCFVSGHGDGAARAAEQGLCCCSLFFSLLRRCRSSARRCPAQNALWHLLAAAMAEVELGVRTAGMQVLHAHAGGCHPTRPFHANAHVQGSAVAEVERGVRTAGMQVLHAHTGKAAIPLDPSIQTPTCKRRALPWLRWS